MDAVKTVFGVYGALSTPLVFLAALMFVIILASQGASWMIISDRMQALTAADGAFFGGFFGKFHKKLGTPVHVNLLSGVVATVFLIAAMQLTGSSAALFQVVLNISISTFLLSYLLIVPAAIKLRHAYPGVERPYRVPGSNGVFTTLGVICFLWVLLGSWVTVFPGTLEALFGIAYDFEDNWGVQQLPFELLTIGTLVVLGALALVGYIRGARIRAERPLPDTTTLTTIDDDAPVALEGER